MQQKSVTKNYIYNLTYQILILILPLVTTPYISRILGAQNIGIFSFTTSISAYFILFGSLGIALYGQREIAYVQNNKQEYSKTFFEIVLLRILTIFISLLFFYFVFVIGNNDYKIYYKILVLEIVGNCIDISWFFQVLEEFKKTVIRNIFVRIIGVLCIFTFVKHEGDLVIYFIIYTLSGILGNCTLWLYLPKYLTKINVKKLEIFKHLKPTLMLFIPQIAIQVYTLLDRTMLGFLETNISEVGYYEQSQKIQKIIKILLAVITSMGTVMLPRISNNFANGEKESINEYIKKSFNIVFLLAFPMIFGIIAISQRFVPVFFGDGFEKVGLLMKVISPIILIIGMSNVVGMQYLLPTKRQKEFTISVICGAIINFVLNFILIMQFKSIGASIATVIAEITVVIVQIYFIRKEFDIKNIIKISKNYLISSIIMFIICTIVINFIYSNVISILIGVITGGITYLICLLFLKDKFIIEIINKIKNVVIKLKGR